MAAARIFWQDSEPPIANGGFSLTQAALPMRYATLLFACLLAAFASAGCASTKKIAPDTEYQAVRQVEGLSADAIYERSLSWMAENFVSANDAIQIRDDENSRLVANAALPVPDTGFIANMNVIVEARDGRFRFTARNFSMRIMGMEDRMTRGMYEDLKPELKRRVSDLQSYIESEAEDKAW